MAFRLRQFVTREGREDIVVDLDEKLRHLFRHKAELQGVKIVEPITVEWYQIDEDWLMRYHTQIYPYPPPKFPREGDWLVTMSAKEEEETGQ